MQITSNTTAMEADLSLSTDKEGRSHCIVVVKGTFSVGRDGAVSLAKEQVPLVFADEHHGDPAETSIKYESDFAPFKPRCDVLVNGSAYAPGGKPATSVVVGLRVGAIDKSFTVLGEREWRRLLLWSYPSRPEPFERMPISYDRAFGGADVSKRNPDKVKTYVENPVGVGYYPLKRGAALAGKPLPNTEETGRRVKRRKGKYRPMSFGPQERNFPSRVRFAGTYDQKWQDERYPFLPGDFDDQYFLSAPADQQIPFLKGGEAVRCTRMNPEGVLGFVVPQMDVPIVGRFHDREERPAVNLDTLIVEPDQHRFILCWRARIPLGRKIHALREVRVGTERSPEGSKPHFGSIQELIDWRKGVGPR